PINGADIYINGNLTGTTNQNGRHTFPDLVFGSYPVEVKKTGYIPSNRTIIVSNKSEDYSFTLSFEGSDLTILVKDKDTREIPNASIVINGAVSGQTDNHGQYTTRVTFNKVYNITASHDGYQSASAEKQVVQGNATDSVTISLEKTMDWGFLEIIVIIVIVVIVLFAVFRKFGKKPGHHVMRRNEI
ncbi:MAG: PEGA domain-containing protein, partial [Methanoregulaceae archaeon]